MNFILVLLVPLTFVSCRTLGTIPINSFSIPAHSLNYGPYTPDSYSTALTDTSVEPTEPPEETEKKAELHRNMDLTLGIGKFVERQGILKDLGNLGYTFSAEFAAWPNWSSTKQDKILNHGFFVNWTFDHFVNTKSDLLEPIYKNEDYTNYMLGFGYAYRRVFDRWQIHYRGGLAFNFIEIDSFRSNEDMDDQTYTDITVSTIHKLGFDYLIRKVDKEYVDTKSQIRIGPTLFYYWSPDPLGKFKLQSDSEGVSPGGSMAIMLEMKLEMY